MRLDFTLKAKAKKCRVCRQSFMPYSSTTVVCSIECAIENNKRNTERLEARRMVIAKREHKKSLEAIKPLSDWLNDVQEWCNRYIRLRDAHLPCISCGTTKPVQYCAGHYRTRKAAPHLRFNEDNIHKQCNSYCNRHLSGNIINYTPALIAKIGQDRVDALMNNNEIHRYTVDECKELIIYFKAKVKELERVKNAL